MQPRHHPLTKPAAVFLPRHPAMALPLCLKAHGKSVSMPLDFWLKDASSGLRMGQFSMNFALGWWQVVDAQGQRLATMEEEDFHAQHSFRMVLRDGDGVKVGRVVRENLQVPSRQGWTAVVEDELGQACWVFRERSGRLRWLRHVMQAVPGRKGDMAGPSYALCRMAGGQEVASLRQASSPHDEDFTLEACAGVVLKPGESALVLLSLLALSCFVLRTQQMQ